MSSYQVLARKWRPQKFADMIGQDHVLRALVNALDNQRIHHAYLFTGMRGVGKTTIARIFAKCLNCETKGVSAEPCGTCSACVDIDAGRFFDLIEVDAASRTKVDETRELLENVPYAPASGRYKVYLIDEVHMFSTHSFNALLKTLEEPPEHVKFLLATTDPQKVPVTVLSRCLQFNLKRMASTRLADYLSHILETESMAHDKPALELIARAADGSVRDSLSLVEQAAAFGGGEVRATDVESMLGRVSTDRLIELIATLGDGNAKTLFEQVDALAEYAPDYVQVIGEMLSLLHQIAMIQTVPESADAELASTAQLQALALSISAEELQLYYQIGQHARRDLPHSSDQREAFDMALMRMMAFAPQSAVVASNPASGPASCPASAPASAKSTAAAAAIPATGSSAAAGKSATAAESNTSPAAPGHQDAKAATQTKTSSEIASVAPVAKSTTKSGKPDPAAKKKGAKKTSAERSLAAAALAAANAPDDDKPARAEKKTPVKSTEGKPPPVAAALTQTPATHEPSSIMSGAETESPTNANVKSSGKAKNDESSSHHAKSHQQKPDRQKSDKQKPDGPSSDKPSIDKPSIDKPNTDKPSTYKPSTDKPNTDKPSTDKRRPDKPASNKPLSVESITTDTWPDTVEKLGLSGMPRQLASQCIVDTREGTTIHLKIEEAQSHLNTTQFSARLQTAISERTRSDITLNITPVEGELHTPARIDQKNKDDALAAARVAIDEDPMVKQLLSSVDGVVDANSVQPIEDKIPVDDK